MEKEIDIKKYLFWAGIAVILVLAYFVIKSYIIPLISAFILAYLVKPIYEKLKNHTGKILAALLCILLIITLIIVPIGILISGVVNQTYAALNIDTLSSITDSISQSSIFQKYNIDINVYIEKFLNFIITLLTSAITYLPSIIITITITLLGIYYFLTDWDKIIPNLEKHLPFKNKKEITQEIGNATNGIVYGTFLIAIIEFAISAIAFFLLGVELYLLLPTLIGFLAFIPGLGPALIWIPMVIYYIATQSYGLAIGVGLVGLFLSYAIDTILRGRIIGKRAKLNPLIMLVGILGGISVFGIFGFIIGPLILIYAIKIIQSGVE
ncbi:MAG: AI-2E family transporter [Nanoarchaeota archaeon]|nr:AI-2E family transporter [Nanoarchaeota archaeon]